MCDGGHLTLHALLWAKRNFRTRLNLNFRFARDSPESGLSSAHLFIMINESFPRILRRFYLAATRWCGAPEAQQPGSCCCTGR